MSTFLNDAKNAFTSAPFDHQTVKSKQENASLSTPTPLPLKIDSNDGRFVRPVYDQKGDSTLHPFPYMLQGFPVQTNNTQ